MAQHREARRAQLAAWEKLTLRQAYADEAYMRRIIAAAGLTAPTSIEPATVVRLQQLLRRAGYTLVPIEAAIGCTLARFIELNTRPGAGLALWAALAQVLELLGVEAEPGGQ